MYNSTAEVDKKSNQFYPPAYGIAAEQWKLVMKLDSLEEICVQEGNE